MGKLRLGLAAAVLLALAAAGCAESQRSGGGEGAAERNESEPFVFAGAGDPVSMDPGLASDGETFRVSRQVFETLLQHEPGGTKIVGGLAESWEQSEDGRTWTFKLRDGVKFHDGEDFNAEAVCANYDRWFNFSGNFQHANVAYYWRTLFGGFAKNEKKFEPPAVNYDGCTAADDLTAEIKVLKPSSNYPGAFSMIALGIMSPKAIEATKGTKVTGSQEAFNYPDYAMEAGTVAGTGPYRLEEWDRDAQEVKLERFDGYWGEKAKIKNVVFKTISDENARKQALEAGDIHGYDLVAPQDVEPLKNNGFEVPTRDVFNILYLGMNQEANTDLEDVKVRQAIAHALNRQRVVDTILPEGGVVATQFMPDNLDGYADDVKTYDYNVDTAKSLLEDAGKSDLEVKFCYPTEVTRPYMPAPKDIFEILKGDVEAAGITVESVSKPWGEYLDLTASGKKGCDLYLLGWTGDFNDAFNFIGTWFSKYDPAWGFRNKELFDDMAAASSEPDPAKRVEMYQDLNRQIMEFLPGVPISSSPPSIAFSGDINPPAVSPLTQENFSETSWK